MLKLDETHAFRLNYVRKETHEGFVPAIDTTWRTRKNIRDRPEHRRRSTRRVVVMWSHCRLLVESILMGSF